MSLQEKLLSSITTKKVFIYLSINATGRGMAILKTQFSSSYANKENFSPHTSFPIWLHCLTVPDIFYHRLTLTGTH